VPEEIFPPITLQTRRQQWKPKDKLARLVTLAREIGYCEDMFTMNAERAEERALFDELMAVLAEKE
jgi:hypothetical protein